MTRSMHFSITAARPCQPRAGQRARASSSKGDGLVLEARFQTLLPAAIRGQWFAYRTPTKLRHCQVDFILYGTPVFVFDCKNTWHPQVIGQLSRYCKVVKATTAAQVYGIAVVNSPGRAKLVCETLAGAMEAARSGFDCRVALVLS